MQRSFVLMIFLAALFSLSGIAQAQRTDGTLTYNTPLSGTLTSDQSRAIYTFTAEAGDVVTVTLRAAAFDAYLLLRDPSGAVMAENNNGGGGTDARIRTVTLDAAGTYYVDATSASGSESGDFTLMVQRARYADSGAMAYNEIVIGRMSGDGPANYTFEGSAGDRITIELTSTDFDPAVVLFNPSEDQIAFNDDAAGLDSRISGFELPDDGTYTIIVDGYRGMSGRRQLEGSFALTLESDHVSAAPERQATPVPETATPIPVTATPAPADPTPPAAQSPHGETIGYGQTIEGALTEDAQQVMYQFNGTAGDVISLALQAPDFDALLQVIGPDGQELAFDDDSGGDLNPLINGVTLPETGLYIVIVDGYRGVNGDRQLIGPYTLTLTAGSVDAQAQPQASSTPMATDAAPTLPPTFTPTPTPLPATPTPLPTLGITPTPTPFAAPMNLLAYGESVQDTFDAANRTVSYNFEGRAGEKVFIRLESAEFDPLVRLIGPDGFELIYDDDSGGSLQAEIRNFTLPADGIYKIMVDTYLDAADTSVVGSFTLHLNLVDASMELTPAPTVTPAIGAPPTLEPRSNYPDFKVAAEVGGLIAYGDERMLSFEGTPNEFYAFRFRALRDDVVSVRVISEGSIDTALYLLTPADASPYFDDDSGAGLDPEMSFVTMPAGEQVLVIMPVVPGSRGDARLELVLESPTMLSEPRMVQLTDKHARQVFEVPGSAGEQFRLTIASQSDVSGTPIVTVYQGTNIIAQNAVGRNLRLSFDFVLQTNEPVQIVVEQERWRGYYAVFELALERIP